jgi:hypothetical protein
LFLAIDVTTKIGAILGAATVDLTKGAIEVVIGEQEKSKPNSTSKSFDAIHNLTKTGLEAFTEVSGAVSGATKDVVKKASSSAVDVVEHQYVLYRIVPYDRRFGQQVGQFAKDGLSIGENIVETLDTVHNTSARKIARNMVKAAGKGILDNLKNKEESEEEAPNTEKHPKLS